MEKKKELYSYTENIGYMTQNDDKQIKLYM